MADRTLTPQMSAAIEEPMLRPAIFAELDFLAGPVRLWNGFHDFVWDGNTFFGKGLFVGVEGVEESTDGSATEVTLTLSGIDPSLIGSVYSDRYQGRNARVWLGLMEGVMGYGANTINNPTFAGLVGWAPTTATLSESSGELTVTLTDVVGYASQTLLTQVGEQYRVAIQARRGTATNAQLQVWDPDSNAQIAIDSTTQTSNELLTINFTALSSTTQIRLRCEGTSGQTAIFEDPAFQHGIPGRLTQVVPDPVPYVFGLMSALAHFDDGVSATLSLTVVSQSLDQRYARRWRLSHEHQLELFPGNPMDPNDNPDLGLEFLPGLSQKQIKFGG